MKPRTTKLSTGREGYALLTVTLFVLVVVLSGMTFFAMTSYETKGALYRQNSNEAFYLADGVVERARAKFLEDRTWRAGWTNELAGRGSYDLTVTDTTYAGHSDVVRLLAAGHVENADRKIEVMAKVPPTGFGLGILILGDADVGGNLCLDGSAHVVGDADFGPNDVHLKCGGDYTDGFVIYPPPMYTDPGHYPEATYYYVFGTRLAADYQARIFDRLGNDITTALGDSLVNVTSYDVGKQTFIYDFDSEALIEHYFNDATGVFRRNAGDEAVVVNFGEVPLLDPPGIAGLANVILDGGITTVIHTTIFNTRFTGVTETERLDTINWMGGLTVVKQIIVEPFFGLAFLVHDFEKQGGSLSVVGTETWPALVYVTQDVVAVNSNFLLHGAITCLRDWNSTGGPNLTYDGGFIANLPGYLVEEWPSGVSGTLEILRWREVSSTTN